MGHKKTIRIDPLTQAMPQGGVDSHAHLHNKDFDADREAVLKRAHACGISRIMNIFLDPVAFEEQKKIFDGHPEVSFVLGMHPSDGLKFDEAAFAALKTALANEPRIRAIGEIGLDYHFDHCPREVQLALFARQLDMARELERPVVIHCRDAEAECLTVLEARGFAGRPLLWHCFGGDAAMARRLAKNGWHVSVPGTVTYPANSALREALAVIPEDRLLVETDCPYLSPMPWRGTRNEPAYTVFTVRRMAEALGTPPETLWRRCGDNARRFFGLTEEP